MNTGFYTALPVDKALQDVSELFGFNEDSFDITQITTVSEEQFNALANLYMHIDTLTKEELAKYDPADIFVSGWFDTPVCELFDYRTTLTNTQELLQHLIDNKITDSNIINLLVPIVAEKLSLVCGIIETYTKDIFSTKLKHLLETHAMSQSELAQKLGVKQQTVSLWIQASGYPTQSTAIELCNIFNISLDFLFRPDMIAQSMEKHIVYQNCGLDEKSTAILEELHKHGSEDMLRTLNMIIQSKGSGDEDLLQVLTEFMNLPCETGQCVVPFKELLDLQEEIQMADSKEDALAHAKGFLENYINLDVQGFRKYQLDKIMLVELIQILTRMRDERVKEVY